MHFPSTQRAPAAHQPGPVTLAIRALRGINLDPVELLEEQHADERDALASLRRRIEAQLEADFDRIDRCLSVLNAIDGDEDREADYATRELDGRGGLCLLGRSADDEPSLCARGAGDGLHASTNEGDDREGDAGDEPEVENEHLDEADREDAAQPVSMMGGGFSWRAFA